MNFTRPVVLHVDGPDGAGKSTACKDLYRMLRHAFDTELLAFPTELPGEMDSVMESTYFYLSDFREEFARKLYGNSPDVVILDRSFVSTAAYQGFNDDDLYPTRRILNGRSLVSLILQEGLGMYKGPYFHRPPVPVFCFFYAYPSTLVERIQGEDAVGQLSKQEQKDKIRKLSRAYREVQQDLQDYVPDGAMQTVDASSAPSDIVSRLLSITHEAIRSYG